MCNYNGYGGVIYLGMNKQCSRCNKTLSTDNFGKNTGTRDGLTYWCKTCIKQNSSEQYAKNKEVRLAQQKVYQAQNKQVKAVYDQDYRDARVEQFRIRDAKYYQEHKEEINAKNKRRRETSPEFRLACYLRTRLYNILQQHSLSKTSKLGQYLGCTLDELKVHLEKQFAPGMTWDNQGQWHVDHILPLTPEVPLIEEEIYKRCHFTNLQPLWAKDNLRKSNKIVPQVSSKWKDSQVQSLLDKEIVLVSTGEESDFDLQYQEKTLHMDIRTLLGGSEDLDKSYQIKRQVFSDQSRPYLQFFTDELQRRPTIIRSVILSRLGLAEAKFFARNLVVRPISAPDAHLFFSQNHLMGSRSCRTVGLFDGSSPVCALGFVQTKEHIEISRFCTKLNTSCAGGFGKLVSYLKQFNLPIVSYCDLRYSDGHSYQALGFEAVGETLGFSWTDGTQRFNRLMCRASVGRTEKEVAQSRSWFKIYDAGQRKYVLPVPGNAVG